MTGGDFWEEKESMDKHILARLKEAMKRFGLDAMVAYSMENVAYGIGYIIPSQALNLRARQFAVAVNRDGKATLLLTSNELPEAAPAFLYLSAKHSVALSVLEYSLTGTTWRASPSLPKVTFKMDQFPGGSLRSAVSADHRHRKTYLAHHQSTSLLDAQD